MIIIWFDEAADDLENIYDFYFVKDPYVATRIYNRIVNETILLKTHPFIAAREPLLKDKRYEYRSLVTKDGLFKIIYYVLNDTVFITNVWCCRSDTVSLSEKTS